MEAELRQLIGKYGVADLHRSLTALMRADFDYLQSLFSVPVAFEEPPAKPKKQYKKRKPAPSPVPEPESENKTQEIVFKNDTIPAPVAPDSDIREVLIRSEKRHTEAPFKDSKQWKAEQKAAELKKRAELDAQGIFSVETLLTKENLEKWILKEHRTYAYIAREYVGCPEALVSETARAYGIQSENSMRRKLVIAKARQGN